MTVFWKSGDYTAAAVLNNGGTQFDENGNIIKQTDAPHMLCAPIGTRWATERKNIMEGYPGFRDYVNNSSNSGVWESATTESSFNLYEDNPSPLKYGTMDLDDCVYYDNIVPITVMEGTILSNWQAENKGGAPLDFGNWDNLIIQPEDLFSNAGLAVGDVIRFYCSKKADGDFGFKVYGGHWDKYVPINGWSFDGDGTMISNSAKAVFNANGYIEIPVTSDNINAFTSQDRWSSGGGAIILQGNNLKLEGISIIKAQ